MKHLYCSSCSAVNRVDPDRLAKAVCGKCAKPLTGGVLHLNATTMDGLLARDELPLVVDFWAPWCGPCRQMAPAFEQAAGLMGPTVRFGKVDTEAEQALGARFGIQSIPTVALFVGGREVGRIMGARGASDIVNWVKQRLG